MTTGATAAAVPHQEGETSRVQAVSGRPHLREAETVTGSAKSRGRVAIRLRVSAMLVCPLVLAGCAAGAARTGGPAVTVVVAAQRLLREIVLPSGAAPLASRGGTPTGFQSDELGCAGMAEREQYWRLPTLSIAAAQAWFEQHVPKGLRVGGTGSGGDRSRATMTEVDYTVRSGATVSVGSRLAASHPSATAASTCGGGVTWCVSSSAAGPFGLTCLLAPSSMRTAISLIAGEGCVVGSSARPRPAGAWLD